MKKITSIAIIVLFASATFTACKKKDSIDKPQVLEQELITTVKLHVTDTSGFDKTFAYKVDNGFGSTSQGQVSIDTVVLSPLKEYNVEVLILNEAANPVENTTEEILTENLHHLFLFQSSPATGAGSITATDGSKDDNGAPFNQKIVFETGTVGTGQLTVTLKHEPTDKTATTPDAAGGETDAQAIFPVRVE